MKRRFQRGAIVLQTHIQMFSHAGRHRVNARGLFTQQQFKHRLRPAVQRAVLPKFTGLLFLLGGLGGLSRDFAPNTDFGTSISPTGSVCTGGTRRGAPG